MSSIIYVPVCTSVSPSVYHPMCITLCVSPGADPGGPRGPWRPPHKKFPPQTIYGSTIVRRGSRGAKGALAPPTKSWIRLWSPYVYHPMCIILYVYYTIVLYPIWLTPLHKDLSTHLNASESRLDRSVVNAMLSTVSLPCKFLLMMRPPGWKIDN